MFIRSALVLSTTILLLAITACSSAAEPTTPPLIDQSTPVESTATPTKTAIVGSPTSTVSQSTEVSEIATATPPVEVTSVPTSLPPDASSTTPAAVASPTLPPSVPKDLEERVTVAYQLLTDDEWSGFYDQFVSVRFKGNCSKEIFAFGLSLFLADVSFANPAIEDGGTEARVKFESLGGNGDRWILLDGEWWYEPDEWQQGC